MLSSSWARDFFRVPKQKEPPEMEACLYKICTLYDIYNFIYRSSHVLDTFFYFQKIIFCWMSFWSTTWPLFLNKNLEQTNSGIWRPKTQHRNGSTICRCPSCPSQLRGIQLLWRVCRSQRDYGALVNSWFQSSHNWNILIEWTISWFVPATLHKTTMKPEHAASMEIQIEHPIHFIIFWEF